jgi:hypothetical protein
MVRYHIIVLGSGMASPRDGRDADNIYHVFSLGLQVGRNWVTHGQAGRPHSMHTLQGPPVPNTLISGSTLC